MTLQRLTAKGRLMREPAHKAAPLLALMCGDGLHDLLFDVLHVETRALLHWRELYERLRTLPLPAVQR